MQTIPESDKVKLVVDLSSAGFDVASKAFEFVHFGTIVVNVTKNKLKLFNKIIQDADLNVAITEFDDNILRITDAAVHLDVFQICKESQRNTVVC